MSGADGGGWDPPADPYEPPPPPANRPPLYRPGSAEPPGPAPSGSGWPGAGPGPGQPSVNPPPAAPLSAYGPSQSTPGAPAHDPYGGGGYGGGFDGPPGQDGYGSGGPYPENGGGNRAVWAVAAVAVVAVVVVGLVVALNRQSGGSSPTTLAATSRATTSSTSNSTTSNPTTSDSTTPSTTSTTSATSSSNVNDQNLCVENDASTNLIHVTVTLGSADSYDKADEFDRNVLNSCATPAAIKELAPYFRKSFGLPGGDLTGGDGSGATARYSVQLVNTSTYVTFTLNRKVGTPGYQIVSVSGS